MAAPYPGTDPPQGVWDSKITLIAICHHISCPLPFWAISLSHTINFLRTAIPSLYSFLLATMDAHARSLLERLNTSTSPKPLKSSSATPEQKSVVTSPSAETQVFQPSPTSRLSKSSIGESEDAAMSVKDLLDSARQRSRESSHVGIQHAPSNSTEAVVETTSLPCSTAKPEPDEVVHLSDGASSGNAEETFATPSGSNKSSVVSNTEESLRKKSGSGGQASPPPGRRIPSTVSSLITLLPSPADLPRLQIKIDSAGRTFVGDGIEQIANLARTFGVYDREIIGATSKYIVYALKGSVCCVTNLILEGRIRIIDQNSGTRAIAETPSSAPVISLTIRDGSDGEESFLLVLDSVHELTIWSIKPWKIDSADVPYNPPSCNSDIDSTTPSVFKRRAAR
jgi:hypothetical protein